MGRKRRGCSIWGNKKMEKGEEGNTPQYLKFEAGGKLVK